jgi:hypothetical protein
MRQARKQDNEQINVPLKVNKYIVNKWNNIMKKRISQPTKETERLKEWHTYRKKYQRKSKQVTKHYFFEWYVFRKYV